MSILADLIRGKVEGRAEDWARMTDAGDIVERFVSGAFPRTIDRFEPSDVLGSADYGPGADRSRASEVYVKFRPLKLETDSDKVIAFGTVQKVAQGLHNLGWNVTRADLGAYGFQDGMDISIRAVRELPGRKRLFRPDIPPREVVLKLSFEAMPDTPRCRVVESVEVIPASTRKVKKVVCDGDGSSGILTTAQLTSGETVDAEVVSQP